MKHFDVVVVGAGPAGCATAISGARLGLRVALIERQTFPRFRPGESLHPGIEPLLQQLGVAEQLCGRAARRFDGQWVHWDGPPRFNGFGADERGIWQGFHLERAQLDATLVSRAAALGVKVQQPCGARRVLTKANRVIGVDTDSGCLYAPYVIDASGARGWLSHQLELPIRHCSPPLLVRYGYLRGRSATFARAAHLQADPGGWTWIAQVEERLLHWTRLTFEQNAPMSRATTLPEALQALPAVGPLRGADVTWRITPAAAGAGYFLVGDAANRLDPASSHGVLKALMSGMQAAQVLADCLHRPALQVPAQMQYRQWLSDGFAHDMAQLQVFYLQHPGPQSWLPVD
ncbi:flavin-dependent dehydrogenase [Pseudomonas helmanticensis]|uniref:Flavin-dependent dehydrogenase n=1 Tax=Pseudomonas helmanticensis TaxID=1471381 RepID=A0A4R7VTP3_9PSED|nr:NAD(P)/FAD-dependent oxidoreductase [Pseudomonas helmanticensis]TDV53266.1 flavin-dependent dehydrogenase [Pseudomonas helmanticensis]